MRAESRHIIELKIAELALPKMHSSPPSLNLVVIRSPDIDRAVRFYQALGLVFSKHRHGSGPEHFSSDMGGFVFEIYPLSEGQPPSTAARIGFTVDDVDALIPLLIQAGGSLVSEPKSSPWGRRVVLRDLDGHSVELVSKPSASEI